MLLLQPMAENYWPTACSIMMEVTSRSSYFLGLRVWAWKQVLHRSHLLEGRTVQTLSTACCHCQKSWKQRSSPKTKLMSAAGGNCLILHGLSSEKRYFNTASRNESDIMEPDIFRPPQRLLNFGYLCSHENTEAIEANIRNRKGVGNIQQVVSIKPVKDVSNSKHRKSLIQFLLLCCVIAIVSALIVEGISRRKWCKCFKE